MNGYETLDYFGKLFGLIASLFVVAICLRAYQRTGILPLLLIGISAFLGILALTIDLIFLRRVGAEETKITLWITMNVFWILYFLLFSTGICLLVFKVIPPAAKSKAQNDPS
ncbi:MAG: hypothetical protein AAGF67_18115 [Verrucomicrobiota bacterium]